VHPCAVVKIMTSGQRDWDAQTYDKLADPMTAWGARVLDRLMLRGDEVVMDGGCGSGRVTRLLLERLPRGRVYGVDNSPAMLDVAAQQLGDGGGRLTLVEADLTTVRLPEPLDAVFSNATFHWIHDHEALFRNLAGLLRPGGALAAQCGGAGNIAAVCRLADAVMARRPFATYGVVKNGYHFAGPEETRARLAAAGFTDIVAWLEPQPVTFPTAEAFAGYLQTIVLGPYLALLPESLHDDFIAAVVADDARHGATRTVDYVRLNVNGVRCTERIT
jgi:trans-aconitate 2-methyltransferase